MLAVRALGGGDGVTHDDALRILLGNVIPCEALAVFFGAITLEPERPPLDVLTPKHREGTADVKSLMAFDAQTVAI